MMDIRPLKRALRAKMRKSRQEACAQTPDAPTRLATQFLSCLALAPESLIAGYAAIDSELDPLPLLEQLYHKGHRLALPCVTERKAPLLFRSYAPHDPLEAGLLRVKEPLSCAPIVVPDYLLVPLLAFDSYGHRLGYGGGYYDRTIHQLREKNPSFRAFGLAFAAQQVSSVPKGAYDRPLDAIITEKGLVTP